MPLFEDARLGELADITRAELVIRLESDAPPGLVQALSACEAQGLEPGLLTRREIHFALAGSLGRPDSRPDSREEERIRFVDRDPSTGRMTVKELFDRLSRPFNSTDASTGFSEFLWSAACEQKQSRRLESESARGRAERSFRALYNRLSGPLQLALGAVCRRWDLPPGVDSEQIANDTWWLAYDAYWSPASRNRLLGQATIRTLLGCIARRLVRSNARGRSSGTGVLNLEDVEEPIEPDPYPDMWHGNAGRVIKECLPQLPPRCRIVAYMYFVQGITNSEIARRLQIERTAVSNHLKKAEKRVRQFIECEAEVSASP